MKKENAKCKCCDTETSGQNCQLAAYTTVIDGKMYTFCCQTRANQYKQKETKSKQILLLIQKILFKKGGEDKNESNEENSFGCAKWNN